MANFTEFGIQYQMNMFRAKLKELSLEERMNPAFSGPDVDSMTEGSSIYFYCPLGCGENLELKVNTIGFLDIVLEIHFKECDKRKTTITKAIEAGQGPNGELRETHIHSISDEAKATGLPDPTIPLVFPDGQMGRCKIDPKTGHIIVTSMWMRRDDQVLSALNDLLNEFSWSATVPKHKIKEMILDVYSTPEFKQPSTPTDFSYLSNHPKGFA